MEDLNLLRVLAVLLEEKSVTRAGHRLGVSQSAVSHKLKQLRERFGDPLFVSSRGGLAPTERALLIGGPLAEAIRDAEAAAQLGERFEPETSTREFTIAASDHAEFNAFPSLVRTLRSIAPSVNLVVVHTGPKLLDQLEAGTTDCALGPGFRQAFKVPTLRRKKVLSDSFVLLMRKGHPHGARRLTMKRLAALEFLQIAPTGRPGGPFDALLAKHGLERRVAMRTPYFVSAPFIVASTDLVMVSSRLLAEKAASYVDLELRPLPVALPVLDIYLLWHERQHHDSGNRWMRTFLTDLFSKA